MADFTWWETDQEQQSSTNFWVSGLRDSLKPIIHKTILKASLFVLNSCIQITSGVIEKQSKIQVLENTGEVFQF